MGQKLKKDEKELYKRIDEVLHYIWDPIGICGVPEARDEYYSYIPEVFKLSKYKNSEKHIVEYLNKIRSENMGLGSDSKKCIEVAYIITNWSSKLNCQTESEICR